MHRIAIDFSSTLDVPAAVSGQGAVVSGRAVDHLLRCSQACSDAAAQIEMDLLSVKAERARLMLACAEACRAAAHVMILGVPYHHALCEACAESCADDGDLAACAVTCRDCAQACRRTLSH